MSSGNPLPWLVLDPEQFARIGRVHRGFFYQHLLGVSIALSAIEVPGSVQCLRVESDEDLEVQLPGGYLYLQVKTTEDALVFSEIASSVVGLHKLRVLHAEGNRQGTCLLALVVAGRLGPELTAHAGATPKGELRKKLVELAQSSQIVPEELIQTWQSIQWILPGHTVTGLATVRVFPDVRTLLDELVTRTRAVPRLISSPDSAVLAAAATINLIAADAHPHVRDRTLNRAQCEALLERIARLPEPLPPVPPDFIPLEVPYPLIKNTQKICFIGGSGSGKSTHLSFEASSSNAERVFYLLPRGESAEAIALDLVNQLGSGLPVGALPPGVANIASREVSLEERLSRLAAAIPPGSAVIIDDAHRLPPGAVAVGAFLRSLVTRSDVSLVLAGQPLRLDGGPTSAALFSLVGRSLDIIDVPGWSEIQVSLWGSATGMPLTPPQADRVRMITAGAPLAVTNLLRIAREAHGGDIDRAIEATHLGGVHADAGAVFERTFDVLPEVARKAACVLAVVDFLPAITELERLIGRAESAAALRRLLDYRTARIIQGTQQGLQRVQIHDAYAAIARQRIAEALPADQRREIHQRAVEIVVEHIKSGKKALEWITAFYSNLRNAGDVASAVNYLTNGPLSVESLNRRGLGPWLVDLLRGLIIEEPDPESRCWLRDGLIFLAGAGEAIPDLDALWAEQVREMAAIPSPTANLLLAFAHKQIFYFQKIGNMKEAERAWKDAHGKLSQESLRLILDYQWAIMLYRERQLHATLELLKNLIGRYCQIIGIKLADIWLQPPEILSKKLHGRSSKIADELSHLADCLDLAGRCLAEQGLHPIELFMQAGILYGMIEHSEPMVKACLFAGELQLDLNHTKNAFWLLSNTLQIIEKRGLSYYLLQGRALLACAAAENGQPEVANEMLNQLKVYKTDEVEDLLRRARSALHKPPPKTKKRNEPELDQFINSILI